MKDQILKALGEADAVYVGDSPLLGSFPTQPEENELIFSWEDEEGSYCCILPEANLETATVAADGFQVMDSDGEVVVLAPHKLQKLW